MIACVQFCYIFLTLVFLIFFLRKKKSHVAQTSLELTLYPTMTFPHPRTPDLLSPPPSTGITIYFMVIPSSQ